MGLGCVPVGDCNDLKPGLGCDDPDGVVGAIGVTLTDFHDATDFIALKQAYLLCEIKE